MSQANFNGFTPIYSVAKDPRDIIAAGVDVIHERQLEIRKALLANNRKSVKGRKYRGLNWVRSKQAQCAVLGHSENPFAGKIGRCEFCHAKMS